MSAPRPGPQRDAGRRWRVSRRGFLIGAGALGAGLALGWRYGLPALWLRTARRLEEEGAPGGVEGPPTAWFEVEADGVALYLTKVEMGQGVHTALAQIAAEELELPWERLRVRQASTARGLSDAFGTGASTSVASSWRPLREAAATLREMLRAEGARRLGVPPERAVAMDGAVFDRDDPTRSLAYGEIAAGADPDGLEVPDAPPLGEASGFRFVGRPIPRVDLPAKIAGRAVYGFDARAPGMRYGAVARPPTIGATLARAAPGDAAGRPGVEAVVIEDGFAGVVATSRRAAYDALDALDLTWEAGEPFGDADLRRLVTIEDGVGVEVQRVGRARRELRRGRLVEAEYRTPLAAHAQLEPQAALVDVRPDGVTAVASTQSPDALRDDLAAALSRPADEVELTAAYLGGGFGRKLKIEAAFEAARLSRAAGVPVHVGWSRAEEFRNGAYRPPTHSVLRAALDPDGTLRALEHQTASGEVAFSILPDFLRLVLGADFGAWRGATVPYAVPHRSTRSQLVALPLPTTWWRGLGLLATTFALESFMDEVALVAGEDPLAYRLRHLGDDPSGRRLAAALRTAAVAADWGGPLPEGRARGIACCADYGTVVAQVAEVSFDGGVPRVHRVTAAVDPGLVVNPDGAEAQTQGAIAMGLGSTLFERLTVRDGAVEAGNFDGYRLLALDEMPEVEVILLESGDEPFGLGEPPIGPVAAAVGNALAALTGTRPRELPLA